MPAPYVIPLPFPEPELLVPFPVVQPDPRCDMPYKL